VIEELIKEFLNSYRAIPNRDGSRAIAFEVCFSFSPEEFKAIRDHFGVVDYEDQSLNE
jgi:hypothetical protein